MIQYSKRKLKTDLAWASAANLFEKIIGYIILAQLTRYLTKEDIGQFFYAMTLATFFALVANMGTGRHFYREFSSDKENALSQLSLAISIRFVMLGGYLLLILAVVSVWQPALLPVMTITAVYIGLENGSYMLTAFFLAKQEVSRRVLIVSLTQILLVILITLAIYLQLPFLTVIASYVVAFIFRIFFSWWLVTYYHGPIRLSWNWTTTKHVLYLSFPFLLMSLLNVIVSRVDTLMLGWLDSYTAVADYETGYKFLEVSRFVVRPALMIFFPIAAPLAAQKAWPRLQKMFRQLVFSGLGLGTAVALFVLILAPFLVPLMFGDKYDATIPITRVLFLSTPFVFVNLFTNSLANALRLEKTIIKGTFLIVILNVALNSYAIPHWGAIGAATTTVISEAALAIWLIYLNAATLTAAMQAEPAPAPAIK
ncbi:MAG: flippase [Chloroflexota bacterium]